MTWSLSISQLSAFILTDFIPRCQAVGTELWGRMEPEHARLPVYEQWKRIHTPPSTVSSRLIGSDQALCPPRPLRSGGVWALGLTLRPGTSSPPKGAAEGWISRENSSRMNAKLENQAVPTTSYVTCLKSHRYQVTKSGLKHKSSETKYSKNSGKFLKIQGANHKKPSQLKLLVTKILKYWSTAYRTSKRAKFLLQNINFAKLHRVTII